MAEDSTREGNLQITNHGTPWLPNDDDDDDDDDEQIKYQKEKPIFHILNVKNLNKNKNSDTK